MTSLSLTADFFFLCVLAGKSCTVNFVTWLPKDPQIPSHRRHAAQGFVGPWGAYGLGAQEKGQRAPTRDSGK